MSEDRLANLEKSVNRLKEQMSQVINAIENVHTIATAGPGMQGGTPAYVQAHKEAAEAIKLLTKESPAS